jgi:hypothetical protein
MPIDALHYNALIETARSELEHAHRAALAAEAGELRRGLQMCMDAINEATAMLKAPPDAPTDASPDAEDALAASPELLGHVRAVVEQAFADFNAGSLVGMAGRIEDARKELGAAP